jgi:DNA mismatch endonuclease, patch repair protein
MSNAKSDAGPQQASATDVFTPEKRSEVMARVGTKNTKPELLVRSLLHKMGYRFRLHRKDLPGSPDIVLPKYRTVIFVHGCFWHRHPGCRRATTPKNNFEYWERKFDRNKERDEKAKSALGERGWNVLTVWECETTRNGVGLAGKLAETLG